MVILGQLYSLRASLVAQLVKNLPARQETRFQFLGWEDALEKEMATHSSILAYRILWTEETGRLQSMGSQESRHNLAAKPPPPYSLRDLDPQSGVKSLLQRSHL